MKVRATLTLRNAVMIERRKKFRLSQKALAAVAGVTLEFVARIEKLDFSDFKTSVHFYGKTRYWEQKLNAIAGVLEVEAEELVPEEHRGRVFVTRFISTRNVDMDRTLPHVGVSELKLPLNNLTEVLEKVLKERPLRMIQARFIQGKTYDEIGVDENIYRENVRQILVKALNRIDTIVRNDGHLSELSRTGCFENFRQLREEDTNTLRGFMLLVEQVGKPRQDMNGVVGVEDISAYFKGQDNE